MMQPAVLVGCADSRALPPVGCADKPCAAAGFAAVGQNDRREVTIPRPSRMVLGSLYCRIEMGHEAVR